MDYAELVKMVTDLKLQKGNECMICHFPITPGKDQITLSCNHSYDCSCFDTSKMKVNIVCPYCNRTTKIVKNQINKFIGAKCTVVLKSGKNKGNICGRVNCGYHKNKDKDKKQLIIN
jgi:hypothetical protein